MMNKMMGSDPTMGDRASALGRSVASGPSRSQYAAGTVPVTPGMAADDRGEREALEMQGLLRQLSEQKMARGAMGPEDVFIRLMGEADPNMPIREFLSMARQQMQSPEASSQMSQRGYNAP